MAAQQTKTERVQVRIDPVAKHMLERAAALANTTVRLSSSTTRSKPPIA